MKLTFSNVECQLATTKDVEQIIATIVATVVISNTSYVGATILLITDIKAHVKAAIIKKLFRCSFDGNGRALTLNLANLPVAFSVPSRTGKEP